MINGKLRPWGRPDWFFGMPSIKEKDWFIIGCVSTQDRCRALLASPPADLNLSGGGFVEIHDEASTFLDETTRRIEYNRLIIGSVAPAAFEIFEIGLLDPLMPLRNKILSWISKSGGNVVLDVSAFPERFFFPIIRWLVESAAVRSLVFTYMLPQTYTKEDLGYDARDWAHLPTFISDDAPDGEGLQRVIVSVGFVPYSLPEWLKKTYENSRYTIHLMLPFPAAPSRLGRTWEFVRLIENGLPVSDDRRIIRVSPMDLNGVYHRIDAITQNGSHPAVFAPYGPKTHCVAMCLHAVKHSSAAFVTQPTYYHPQYSTGIAMHNGVPSGHAYAIRLNDKDYY